MDDGERGLKRPVVQARSHPGQETATTAVTKGVTAVFVTVVMIKWSQRNQKTKATVSFFTSGDRICLSQQNRRYSGALSCSIRSDFISRRCAEVTV